MKTSSLITKAMTTIALMVMLATNGALAQVPNDSIVADFNEFVRLLEETHPDPYSNYGGKPFFRRAAMETPTGVRSGCRRIPHRCVMIDGSFHRSDSPTASAINLW